MGSGSPKHEKMLKNLSTQLAIAVRSIQWSYGIFWASSTNQERLLERRDGYYNGDIKTRKTVQNVMEIEADKIGLQTREQLKELYKFLLVGEVDPQTKRPSAALSPEDLSDPQSWLLSCVGDCFCTVFVIFLGHKTLGLGQSFFGCCCLLVIKLSLYFLVPFLRIFCVQRDVKWGFGCFFPLLWDEP